MLSRVVWELGLPAEHGTCMMCESKQIETVEHLLFSCPAYQKHRGKLERKAEAAYSLGNNGASLDDTSESRHTRVLLGARAGCGLTEDLIDLALKRFLRKAWKLVAESPAPSTMSLGDMTLIGQRAVGGPSLLPRQLGGRPRPKVMTIAMTRRKSRYSI